MKIAILGATSQIAKDLIKLMSESGRHELYLYARRPVELEMLSSRHAGTVVVQTVEYASFGKDQEFDALINFVGVGNPAAAAQMGADIFDVTLEFDELALSYVRTHPQCRYIFLSSGAAYGSAFHKPVDRDTPAIVPINKLTSQNWYGAAKLYAECRHRALCNLPIIDIRIFNYFSASQDLNARFLICDILRAIREDITLQTLSGNITRDYLHPGDFYRLIEALLMAPPINDVIDGYSRSPVDKFTLLSFMKEKFGLKFELLEDSVGVNATGEKLNYYSLNDRASQFGYQPCFSSVDGIFDQATVLLGNLCISQSHKGLVR